MNGLDVLYEELDYKSGELFPVTDDPSHCLNSTDWLDKGEWLSAAKRAGIDKVFFVQNNPVVVFAECKAGLEEKIKTFNRAWCLAHPRLLFLSSPGEITVYDLAQEPVDENKKEEWKKLNSLDILQNLNKVSYQVEKYHRDNIESGQVFTDKRFGDLENRADNALIRDLKTVRQELIHAGLQGNRVRFAHSLIGRSIFIRYLEDRGILTKDYFLSIAKQNASWIDLLLKPTEGEGLDFSSHRTYYPRILTDKAFTYALFRNLSLDFNGDMFPNINEEEQIVTQEHLTLIRDLFFGDVGVQKKLFFYSYRFDIIPLDLISSIYEEFYHTSISDNKNKNDNGKISKKRQDGAYYTPPILVEFVLSRILTPEVLEKNPRILDPSCGSGIFLVEAFRRIVRYKRYKNELPLTFEMLKCILKEQIAGIEINEEAARITAFSLYLAMLHYLDPPAIYRQIKIGNKLPNLVATKSHSANHFHCILPGNAFDTEFINSNPLWRECFGDGNTDIVVGNPPWGALENKKAKETEYQHKLIIDWCKLNKKPIGDKEASQAFLWRSLDFLKEKGKAAMLVSAGVLFKNNTTTQAFRNQWLKRVKLDEVFNFAHVRKLFFKGADAPFLSICFSKESQEEKPTYYWSAKQTISINKTQSIILSKYDRHILIAKDLPIMASWKTSWFGRKADTELLRFLKQQKKLHHYVDRSKCGRGYEIKSNAKISDELQCFKKSLITSSFSKYDLLEFEEPPKKLYRLGNLEIFDGHRLVVQKGIKEKTDEIDEKGSIVARYEKSQYCFRHAFYGIKLNPSEEWMYKTVLGIFWSSLARYFFFMTTSKWGLWYHEIYFKEELLQFPIVIDKTNPAAKKIISIVDKLSGFRPQERDILHPDGIPPKEIEKKRREWEKELSEAVFELYGLNEEEKDLIRDFCDVTLPFFYASFESNASMPVIGNNDSTRIEKYIQIFCKRWNVYLGDDEEMRAEVHVGTHGNMVAVEFFPSDKGDPWDLEPKYDKWSDLLEQVGETLPQPMGTSQILLDGVVQVVSESGIIVIKRNERRFWTRSLAREDADAGICKHMIKVVPKEGNQS